MPAWLPAVCQAQVIINAQVTRASAVSSLFSSGKSVNRLVGKRISAGAVNCCHQKMEMIMVDGSIKKGYIVCPPIYRTLQQKVAVAGGLQFKRTDALSNSLKEKKSPNLLFRRKTICPLHWRGYGRDVLWTSFPCKRIHSRSRPERSADKGLIFLASFLLPSFLACWRD